MLNEEQMLLLCLMEECAELSQAASKALRFGLDDDYIKPGKNREDIVKEFSDLLALIKLLALKGFIPTWYDEAAIERKYSRLKDFMEYSRSKGILADEDDPQKITT